MDEASHRYIAVAYKLYTTEDGETDMIEEAPADKPFHFYTGMGLALDGFEKAVGGLNAGESFDFTLPAAEAYGEYVDERVVDLDRSIFTINGHFDHDNIYVDAIVPLQNADGNRFDGRVLAISDTHVKMDLNHQLAGLDLHFTGSIVEARPATADEIQTVINRMHSHCHCGCDDGCDGGCDCGDDHHEHGHHHHGGCGHCH